LDGEKPVLGTVMLEESERRAPKREKLLVDEADNGTRSETRGGEGRWGGWVNVKEEKKKRSRRGRGKKSTSLWRGRGGGGDGEECGKASRT
jgi:hypothetical protein